MADIAVAGVGMTPFRRRSTGGHEGLVAAAVRNTLLDASLQARDIQAAFCGSVGAGPGVGQRVLRRLGFSGIPIVNVENACASGPTAIVEAIAWILAGLCDVALAVGVEILSGIDGPLPTGTDGSGQWIFDTGLNLPGWYALKASAHMAEHGLTREQLAQVVVKSRDFARFNPYACYRTPTTIDEVLSSQVVAEPLTMYQCCPKVDGAAAAIICSADFARRRGLRPTWIRGHALLSGTNVFTDSAVVPNTTSRTAALAYERSGVGPEDIHVLECHDAFSIGEVIYAEALGMCPVGEGGRLVASQVTARGGSGPTINPGGGLLSRGHPLGASGIAQLAEIVWQLRGEAAQRQVPDARIGLVHTMGASEFEIDANACTVFVLEAGA